MSDQENVEVIPPASYQSTYNPRPANNNSAWKAILVIFIVLVLCVCCSCGLVFSGLWASLSWLWNHGDSIFYGLGLLPLVI
jgi:hypothetical protein